MLRDSSGRIVQLTDATGDPLKADLSRTYAMVACACPQPSAGADGALKAKLGHRELLRLLLQNARYILTFMPSLGSLPACVLNQLCGYQIKWSSHPDAVAWGHFKPLVLLQDWS